MIDTQTAVTLAVFAALESSQSVTQLADVWQNPPEDTQPGAKGLVIIGLVALTADGGKDDPLDTATISLFAQVRKPDATLLYALSSAIRAALEGQTIAADGATISRPVFVSSDPRQLEDGETYEDELKFEMSVEPA